MKFLDGKKTYFVAAAAGAVVALRIGNVIDDELTRALLGLLGVTGVVTVRAAIAKAEKAGKGER